MQYHLDFSSAIREQVVFADMAPRFHLMAEETLQRQIQLVIFDLRDVKLPVSYLLLIRLWQQQSLCHLTLSYLHLLMLRL